jgi:hypothetical protein
LCAMEQAAVHAARHAFESLVNGDNDLFVDHLFNYLNTESHSDSGKRRHAPRCEAGTFQPTIERCIP